MATKRCWKLILGTRDIIWGSRCVASWCDLDLTFDLTVVTLTFKILFGQFLGGFRCAILWYDLDWRFDLVVLCMSLKILSGLFLRFCQV